MPTNKAASKFQLLKYPALPSHCASCFKQANGHTEFADFQTDIDYYGAVAVCEDCCRELLDAFGYVNGDRLSSAEETVEILQNEIERLKAKNDELNATLDSVFHLRPNLFDGSNLDDSSSSESVESADRGTEETESGTDESNSERGFEDVPESDSPGGAFS